MLVAVIAVALLVLDWRLALAMYAFLPFGIITVRYFASAQREAHREQRAWLARINAFLNENISGMATVQLFNRQKENLHRFDDRNQGHLGASLRSIAAYAVFEPTVILFNAVTAATILWYGGGRVVQGALSLGTLVVFIQLMQRVYWPLRDLADRYTTMQQAMASSERIFSLLDEPEEIIDTSSPRHLVDVKGKVEFRNVWFAYDEENWVLRDVSFVINPGERVAIVGVTGAGKSTIISLLSRFYDVQRGTILVDDVPVDQIPQRELRRHVGTVLQDTFLFTDTVEENIRLRDSSITSAQVREAAHVVSADDFITQLPEAYSTLLAERGANLSVGQKQLLALTRVAAFNPDIVLVMDEATASIDPLTEAAIQRGIRQVTSGRTSIIIAHRLNTIRDVDWILVMHQGQVAEVGTHEDLLVQRDIYYRLYKLQYDEQESFRTRG
jgi:ABC-type multidrug transport system fused ATPase/permease subunit